MVIHYGIGKGARIFQGKRLPLPDSANNPSLITGARTNSKQTGTVSGNHRRDRYLRAPSDGNQRHNCSNADHHAECGQRTA